ncbi:MAG: hypothetical protein ABIK15_06935 [Pseudomonadota bacterium]
MGLYIQLNRSFRLLPKDHEFEKEESEIAQFLGLGGRADTEGWDQLFDLYRVVILAEAGAGKTEEIQQITTKLRSEGKDAFFFRLESLSNGLQTSFEIGNKKEFESWLSTEREAWFFLDSVDEARLKSFKNFEEAIRNFAAELGNAKQRSHIYITSRPSEWRPNADLSLIKRQLPFFKVTHTEISDEEGSTLNQKAPQKSVKDIEVKHKTEYSEVDPKIFSLLPLDKDQIRAFAIERGVEDVDDFLKAIEKAEAEVFSRRPLDLDDLITYWNENGYLASLKNLIEFSIDTKLKETDPDRCWRLPLLLEEAWIGTEMVAAAVSFQKRERILIPEQNPDPLLKRNAINAADILTGWIENKISALIQRPIFDGAIYGAVRFHHRIVREYLTAKWLHRILLEGKSRQKIYGLFFKKCYGHTVLIPSMRPILSWLILLDDKIREKTIQSFPEVCLQGGDPSSLPTEVRQNMLEHFCALYANKSFKNFSFGIAELRRFSHPDLDSTVARLLDLYTNNDEIKELLLRIAWQGKMSGCSAKSLTYAPDASVAIYSRIYSIRVVRIAGTSEEKHELLKMLLSDPKMRDEQIIRELIDAFSDDGLGIPDILTMLGRLERSNRYNHYYIDSTLEAFSRDKCPMDRLNLWLQGLLSLIKVEPFYERRFFEVSQSNGWLLPYAILAVERLVKNRDDKVINESALEIISLAQNMQDYRTYCDKIEHKLESLVKSWPELNRALFWYDVAKDRRSLEKQGKARLTEYWRMDLWQHYWEFKEEDFNTLVEDIKTRELLDDRLVALSLAFKIYQGTSPKKRVLLNKLKKVVKGMSELEDALHKYIYPGHLSEEVKKHRRSNAAFKRQQKQREKKQTEDRKKTIKYLQSHTNVLRDSSIASEGGVWKATNYLLYDLRHKIEKRNCWAAGQWEKLIPEFGQEVSVALRDGCIDYWRKYTPVMRSEGIENPNSIPGAVIVGICGLEMEFRYVKDWPNNLNALEAELACRFAFHEMNGFPDWFKKLHSVFPDIAEALLLREIKWEFSAYNDKKPCHYVLDDVLWQAKWLYPYLSDKILELLETYEPIHDDTVEKGLSIVLASSNLAIKDIARIAKKKVASPYNDERQARWLAAWMQVETADAIDALENTLGAIKEPTRATAVAMMFSVALVGERHKANVSLHTGYQQPDILLRLIKLLYTHIRREEDIDRYGGGSYSPTLRDNAQGARSRIFEMLVNISGKEAYNALMDLASTHPDEGLRQRCLFAAKSRAEQDAETEPWKSGDIAQFAQEAEKTPKNHRELFELIVSRLLDLKCELEEGDHSQAETYQKINEERLHRIFISHWLNDRSQCKYTVTQEEELPDRKEPDIRVHGLGFTAPVPIELKIADNWHGPVLFERLKNQLCGQYLRDPRSNNGIYLLVYLGEKKTWENPETGKKMVFLELIDVLNREAQRILACDSKIEDLQTIAIDLTKRAKACEHATQVKG